MNLEERTRTCLETITADVIGGPDLNTVIRGGRRRRRTRVAALAASGLAVTAVAAGVGAHQLQRPATTIEVSPATQPAYTDFVPGTDVDETMQATAAQHLPALPAATRVYASDWNHDGALPDAQAPNATDWHADYQLSDQETVYVTMFKRIPGQPDPSACDTYIALRGCTRTEQADGSELLQFAAPPLDAVDFHVIRANPDGSVVEVLDVVKAGSYDQAVSGRSVSDQQAATVVNDPSMTFPDPVVPPPPPYASSGKHASR